MVLALLVGITSCDAYVDELVPNYAFGPPPTGAVYISPGIYYQDIMVSGTMHRRYYRWNGPSSGWRYYNGIHPGGHVPRRR